MYLHSWVYKPLCDDQPARRAKEWRMYTPVKGRVDCLWRGTRTAVCGRQGPRIYYAQKPGMEPPCSLVHFRLVPQVLT